MDAVERVKAIRDVAIAFIPIPDHVMYLALMATGSGNAYVVGMCQWGDVALEGHRTFLTVSDALAHMSDRMKEWEK